jgi:hypothetical protein
MLKVERELLKVTKIAEQEDGEDRQDYLKRLCQAVNVLEDEDWEAVSEEAQEWGNAATRAVKAKKALPDFNEKEKSAEKKDGTKAKPAKPSAKAKPAKAEEEEGEEGEEETEEEDEDDVEDGGTTKKKAAKPAAKDKPRGISAVTFVRQYVAANPQSPVADIAAALEKAGYNSLSTSSIGTIRSDFRSIARVIKEAGMLKKGVDLGV